MNTTRFAYRTVAALHVAVLLLPAGCSSSSDANRIRNIQVVELQVSEIWSKGNVDLIAAVYSEDFIGHFPEGTVRGHDGIRSSVESHRASFPDWTETVEEIIADGDRVAHRFTSRGTNLGEFLGKPATGKRVEISEVCVQRFEDGKIVELWVYPDIVSMQRQLDSRAPEPFTAPQSISFVGLKAEAERITVIEHVNVVPMDSDRVMADQTVLIRGDRIESIQPSKLADVPDNATRIPGRDKYLMPGLADMHVHLAHDEEADPDALVVFLAAGVTTVRNM